MKEFLTNIFSTIAAISELIRVIAEGFKDLCVELFEDVTGKKRPVKRRTK